MKIKIVLLILLCFAAILSVTNAQNSIPTAINGFPPGPTAASLGKFADVPVSIYNGTTEISIPIWDIKEGDIHLPVSLNYHGSGIQVAEVASWVGLGWSLNAGGVITRSVRGRPDDLEYGYLNMPAGTFPSSINNANGEHRYTYKSYADNDYDSQPDLFMFNFAGKTGKFQFDFSGNACITPFQRIRVIPVYHHNTYDIIKWNVTAEDGTLYEFEQTEQIRNQNSCTPSNFTPPQAPYFTTSWFLSKITAPSKASIDFIYQPATPGLTYPIANNETYYTSLTGTGTQENVTCAMYNQIHKGVRLWKIKFTNGEIEFVPSSIERMDLRGDYALDKVLIKNQSSVVKSYQLNYSYMIGDRWDNAPLSITPSTSLRLALLSIQEKSALGELVKNPYKFEYKLGLPDRLSNAVDHWGYYNGQTSNSCLVPMMVYDGKGIPGAIRDPFETYTSSGTLSKITYPTGGNTILTFEANTVNWGVQQMTLKSQNLNCDPHRDASGGIQSTQGELTQASKRIPFTITNVNNQPVEVTLIATNLPCYYNPMYCPCGVLAAVENYNGVELMNSLQSCESANRTRMLSPGTYYLILKRTSNYPNNQGNETGYYNMPFMASVKWMETGNTIVNVAGGIRLQMSETFDGSKLVSRKTYSYNYDNGDPSGRITRKPKYDYTIAQDEYQSGFGVGYLVRTSTPNIPMVLTQGSYVGYGQVTVYHSEWMEGNTSGDPSVGGKTVHKFTTPQTNSYMSEGFPFAPMDYLDWTGGTELEVEDYRSDFTTKKYIKLKKVINDYRFHDDLLNPNSNVKISLGLKIGHSFRALYANQSEFIGRYYKFATGYKELIRRTEITYNADPLSKPVTKVTDYSNSVTHLQNTKAVTTESDGKLTTTYTTYPEDYSDNTGFIGLLKTNNIVNAPIEQVVLRADAGNTNSRVIKGALTTYSATLKGLPDKVYQFESELPVPLSSFRFSNQSLAGVLPDDAIKGAFSLNTTHYVPKLSLELYDNASPFPKGNLLQWRKLPDVPSCAIWGYRNALLTASIMNAAANEVYYEGFEEHSGASEFKSGTGNNLAKTGRKVWASTNFTCAFTAPNTKTYYMTYWYHDGTKWIFSGRKPFSASISLMAGHKLDEVRIFPADAVMTTYAYDPLIGLTSKTNVNNLTEYYEYDALGRLMLVRDDDGNILKKHTYNYKQ